MKNKFGDGDPLLVELLWAVANGLRGLNLPSIIPHARIG
jgi:hypothetical protein